MWNVATVGLCNLPTTSSHIFTRPPPTACRGPPAWSDWEPSPGDHVHIWNIDPSCTKVWRDQTGWRGPPAWRDWWPGPGGRGEGTNPIHPGEGTNGSIVTDWLTCTDTGHYQRFHEMKALYSYYILIRFPWNCHDHQPTIIYQLCSVLWSKPTG